MTEGVTYSLDVDPAEVLLTLEDDESDPGYLFPIGENHEERMQSVS